MLFRSFFCALKMTTAEKEKEVQATTKGCSRPLAGRQRISAGVSERAATPTYSTRLRSNSIVLLAVVRRIASGKIAFTAASYCAALPELKLSESTSISWAPT